MMRRVDLLVLLALVGCQGDGSNAASDPCAVAGFFCGEGFHCDRASATCVCGNDDACGEGYACAPLGQCLCVGDACCPEGFRFDSESFVCSCAAQDCCPEGSAYDAELGACRCGASDCCPEGYMIDPVELVCVCASEDCCPLGYVYDQAQSRCLCENDEVCGAGWRCNGTTGVCECAGDEACAEGEFCNPVGLCQARTGCTASDECGERQICDRNANLCIDAACVIDADCVPGTRCQLGFCVPGCNGSEFCFLAEACIDGYCRGDKCDRDSQCGFGEFCTGAGNCVQAVGEYCAACDNNNDCSSGPCLQRLVEGVTHKFCGVDCATDPYCPNGYHCNGAASGCVSDFNCPQGTICWEFDVLGSPPIRMCAAGNPPRPVATSYNCGPESGTCTAQPVPGETTRPRLGQPCTGLCQAGDLPPNSVVCADAGRGATCYQKCLLDSECPVAHDCTPIPYRSGAVCLSKL